MPSPDLSEFEKLTERSRKRPCKIGAALAALKPADRAKLQAALDADPSRVSNAAITAWCARRNLRVSVQASAYHRRRGCACADD